MPKGKKKAADMPGVPGFSDKPLVLQTTPPAMDDVNRPWSRQRGETAKAYAAFLTYLEMGDARSYAKAYYVSKGRPIPPVPDAIHASGQWVAWAQQHRWRDRVDAWDEEQRLRRSRLQQQYRDKVYMELAQELDALKARLISCAHGEAAMSAIQYQALVQAMRWAGIEEPQRSDTGVGGQQNNVVVYIPQNGTEAK